MASNLVLGPLPRIGATCFAILCFSVGASAEQPLPPLAGGTSQGGQPSLPSTESQTDAEEVDRPSQPSDEPIQQTDEPTLPGDEPTLPRDETASPLGVAEAAVAAPSVAKMEQPEAPRPPAARPPAARQDNEAVFRAFRVHVREERRRRYLGAIGGVVAGGTTMTLGALVAKQTSTSPQPWLIGGGILLLTSATGLLVQSPVERLAVAHEVGGDRHSHAQALRMENKWRRQAESLRKGRLVGGVVGLVLSAACVSAGIALTTGAGGLSEADRTAWGSALIASGSAMAVGAAGNFLLRTPTEKSFATYWATRGGSP